MEDQPTAGLLTTLKALDRVVTGIHGGGRPISASVALDLEAAEGLRISSIDPASTWATMIERNKDSWPVDSSVGG